jgi:tetratricopeptide (TPR) repeat protein
LRRAKDLAGEAIVRQPDFADAYALRGHVLMLLEGGEAESQRMIGRALQLDPRNREALDTHLQMSLGNSDWGALYRDAHRLRASDKRDALYYNGIGFFYQYMGFPVRALEARRRSATLDPLHFSYVHNFELALWHAGRSREALAAAKRALALQPDHMLVLSELCALSAITGDLASARNYSARLSAAPLPHPTWRIYPDTCAVEIVMASLGSKHAELLLNRLDEKKWFLTGFGLFCARAGNVPLAMTYFEKAYDKGELPALIYARYDAMTPKALLNDPRWRALWQRPLLREWQWYHDRIAGDLARPSFTETR